MPKITDMSPIPLKKRAPWINLFLAALIVAGVAFSSGCEQGTSEKKLELREDGLLYEIGEDEPFTGIRIKYYSKDERESDDGEFKKYEIHYKDGLKDGSFVSYHPNGIQMNKGRFEVIDNESVKVGTFIAWRKNGTLEFEKNFENGELHGSYVKYHNHWVGGKSDDSEPVNQSEEEAKRKYEANYENGLREGNYAYYQLDGSKLETGSFKQGKPHGTQKLYFPSIHLLAIKDHKGLRPTEFPATKEGFEEASAQALAIQESTPLSHNTEGKPISVVAFDANKTLLRVLWNVPQAPIGDIVFQSGGSGYSVQDPLKFVGLSITELPAIGWVSEVDNGALDGMGEITEVELEFPGSGYAREPNVEVVSLSGTGSGAALATRLKAPAKPTWDELNEQMLECRRVWDNGKEVQATWFDLNGQRVQFEVLEKGTQSSKSQFIPDTGL